MNTLIPPPFCSLTTQRNRHAESLTRYAWKFTPNGQSKLAQKVVQYTCCVPFKSWSRVHEFTRGEKAFLSSRDLVITTGELRLGSCTSRSNWRSALKCVPLASRELVITRITWSREHEFTTWMERSITYTWSDRNPYTVGVVDYHTLNMASDGK